MSKKNEVVEVEENSTALVEYSEGYDEDAGVGFEGQTQDELSIPFLVVLQQMSPQVVDPSDGGIEGAKPGMLFNTVTQELLAGKDGIVIIPAMKEHVFVEWVPRENGGGLVAVHQKDSPIITKARQLAGKSFGKLQTENGNDLIETHYLYGVVEDKGYPIVIGFTSTKISVFKQWNTRLNFFQIKTKDGRKQTPPLFAHRVKLTTQKQKNNKGDFFNFVIGPAGEDMLNSLLTPNDERYQAAKSLFEGLKAGKLKADLGSQAEAGETGQTSYSSETPNDDDVPF